MSEKKNIDRLFQEKFKEFEAVPQEQLWENIEADLEKDKKRRVIPLWMRLSGVAALLMIGLMVVMPFFRDADTTKNPVVLDKNQELNNDGSNKIVPTDKPLRSSRSVTDAATTDNTNNAETTNSTNC